MAHFLCNPCYMVEGDRWHSCTIFNLCKFYPYVLGLGIWFSNFHGCLMFGGREREGLVYRFQRLNTKPCSFLVLVIQEFPACKRGKSGILALGVEGMGMGWEVHTPPTPPSFYFFKIFRLGTCPIWDDKKKWTHPN